MRLFLFLLLCPIFAQAQNVSLYLDESPLSDVVKLAYGEIAKQPFLMSSAVLEARQPVTLSLRDVPPSKVLEHVATLLSFSGFTAETRAGVVIIDRSKKPDDEIVVYRPRHRSSRYLADIVQPLTGAKSLLSRSFPQQSQQLQQYQQRQQPAQGVSVKTDQSPSSVAGMTDRGEVDQIAFSVPAKDANKLRKLLADLDSPTGEVLLKAAVYEVGTTKSDGSAIQLALSIARIDANVGTVLAGESSIKFKFSGIEGVLSALDRDSRFKSILGLRCALKTALRPDSVSVRTSPFLVLNNLTEMATRFSLLSTSQAA
jgi:type II secretory pathway component GspD/PulD (secretin)